MNGSNRSQVKHSQRFGKGSRRRPFRRAISALVTAAVVASPLVGLPGAQAAPAGQGFVLTPHDLRFILKQIKIAEHHAITETDPDGNPLFGTGPGQISNALLPYGLRTVDGSYNNLVPGQSQFGAGMRVFPRHAPAEFRPGCDSNNLPAGCKGGEAAPPGFPPGQPSYAATSGSVYDSQPRVISNLIVDQTSSNPAAIAAAAEPHRSAGSDPSAVPCDLPAPDNDQAGCTPAGETLFIPNVTTDFGLSPPFNSWFTIFGQFFDHGLDLTSKSGGTVFVPLKADDPLIAGLDRIPGNADDPQPGDEDFVPPHMRFMALTRATNQPGGVHDATNLTSSWVDQSQTYTSQPEHQVFLRAYELDADGRPVSNGHLILGPGQDDVFGNGDDGGMGTWKGVKAQTAQMLGIELSDADSLNIPVVLVDQYGRFLRGPSGLPQLVTASGLVEGNLATPVAVPSDALRLGVPFLADIAHHAAPGTCDPDGPGPNNPPVAQTADSDPGFTDDSDPCTYDDEMLDRHFIAGDPRVNENIALTAIHQVFHSEHNRLVGNIQEIIDTTTEAVGNTTPADPLGVSQWHLADGSWNGERLFQAARFVTEMEYQHLVFEEFARHVQPEIPPFNVFTQSMTGIDPAITAEFAHAVYRFGHSMLTETVARTATDSGVQSDGDANDIGLIEAFLNPVAYNDRGGNWISPEEAAGSIAMGMTDQVANEIDEFVTEALRNNLLGLPLDLPTINMTRAREAGVPSLNNFRKHIYATTNDSAMQPYSSWVDYGLALRHQYSIVNFMAAYGQHPTITAETTLAGKRAAALAIYENGSNPDNPACTPTCAYSQDFEDFAMSQGAWASVNGASQTGVDDVDLWVGGLAEGQNLFAGLLGSTFNYVFEAQMLALQDGDRLYYLSRTSGMPLRSALEGNSFAELVMRNTNAHSLKQGVFDTSDCEFQLGHDVFTTATANIIADDPASECDESTALRRNIPASGWIRYNSAGDGFPLGIDAQNMFNGTADADKIWGGVDNDTFWGNEGDDRIEGNDGADQALGGEGNDIITDLHGTDIAKGGPGNDAIDTGPDMDVLMGGEGKDFLSGGLNANQTFAGEGDDLVIAGTTGADTVFGSGGDDWLQGGGNNDLLQGDSGAPFFDDINKPGHDVLIGDEGEDDYDSEGGDDIQVAGHGIERNHGAYGFDWATHDGAPQPGDSDLTIHINNAPGQLADRFLLTEALSGWQFDDILKGDDWIPFEQDVELHGPWGANALTDEGIDRIAGLRAILESGADRPVAVFDRLDPTREPAVPNTAGPGNVECRTDPEIPGDEGEGGPPAHNDPPIRICGFGSGNILLGGAGSDTFTGRGADDVIDGDSWLNVRLSVRTDPNDPSTEYRSAERLEELQADVFAGIINPGDIVIVREILSDPNPTDVDTAVYTGGNCVVGVECTLGMRADYDLTVNPDGSVTVFHARNLPGVASDQAGPKGDGTDTLLNIERVQFSDGTVNIAAPAAPAIGTATAGPGVGTATARWTQPAENLAFPITGYSVRVLDAGGNQVGALRTAGPNATSLVVNGLTPGASYRFQVAAVNDVGTSNFSGTSNAVTTPVDTVRPTVTSRTPTAGSTNVSVATNATATFSEPVVGLTTTTVTLQRLTTLSGNQVPDGPVVNAVVSYNAATRTVTLDPNANLSALRRYRVQLTSGITDLAGNTLQPVSWTFTTAAPNNPPTVIQRSPGINATGVPRGANVTARFSEQVQGANGTNVTLVRVSNGNQIAATVTYNNNNQTVTLNPQNLLVANAQYRVTLTGGASAIRDLQGAPLTTVTWTFTTGS